MTASKGSGALEIHGRREPVENSDSVLIASLRAGDEESFVAIYRRHVSQSIQFAHRLVSSDAIAYDLVMDVFVRLWRDRLDIPADTRLGPYLKAAVRNACISYLRHHRVEDAVRHLGTASALAPGMGVAPLAPDEEFERNEVKEIIRIVLGELPPRTRLVLELRWFEGKSYKEISRELGIRVKSVENSLARAMRVLRRRLGAEPYDDDEVPPGRDE